jgi:hypothetical protein
VIHCVDAKDELEASGIENAMKPRNGWSRSSEGAGPTAPTNSKPRPDPRPPHCRWIGYAAWALTRSASAARTTRALLSRMVRLYQASSVILESFRHPVRRFEAHRVTCAAIDPPS